MKTGGPAFPACLRDTAKNGKQAPLQRVAGMTLRDYFAAKAMQGFASTLTGTAPVKFDALAKDAYEMAEAMLKAREAA